MNPATIALTRAEDGTLTGQICIGVARWTVTNWRRGSDEGMILFDATEIADPEFEALEGHIKVEWLPGG